MGQQLRRELQLHHVLCPSNGGCKYHPFHAVGAETSNLFPTQTTSLILLIVTSALHLYFLTVWQDYDFKGALQHAAGSAVVFVVSMIVIWPVGALLSYHLRVRGWLWLYRHSSF